MFNSNNKIKCECGSAITSSGYGKHLKTKKHQSFLRSKKGKRHLENKKVFSWLNLY